MVQISESLAWELVKNNNCFMKIRNGRSARTGSIRFSSEPGNLRNISTFQDSGIVKEKTLDIAATSDNRVTLKIKSKSGKIRTTPLNKCFRRSEKTIMSQAISNYYRSDLKKAALAKYSAIYRGNKVATGSTKKRVPVKKGRN
uniref:Ribosomal eL28/Mak16 domain-containing protein n=1 Tax=Proboscia inermis TaxID=420281 RepID=A0A7S0G6T1_9STRA|mmetsp:Transcript_12742/g.12847  ORF Transcript_12742/g.12847 Transcript_12742/m.12847 type:complete len:143 (+) Transcript_12742:69-497(+)